MTNLENLVVTLNLKADQLIQGLRNADEHLKKIAEEAEKAQEEIKEMSEKSASFVDALKEHVVGLMGALASVGAFMAFTEHTVKAQVATQRLSEEAHTSAVELGALQIAADKTGGSAEGVNRSVTMLGEKLSVLGTKMRGAKMAGMALGMALGVQGKAAEAAGVKMFKGKGPMESIMILAEHMQGMDFFKAKKLGAMGGITDEGLIRNMIKGKEAFSEFLEEQRKYAATDEDVEHSLKFEEAQKDAKFALEKVAMTIMQYVLPALKWFSEKLLVISDWFLAHPNVIKGALLTLAAVITLLGVHAIKSGVQMVVAWVASGTSALWAGAQYIWAGAAMMAAGVKAHVAWLLALGPIGLVIGAIELIALVCTALYAKFEGFRNVVDGVFGHVWGVIKNKVENIIDIFSAWWDVIKTEFDLIVALFSFNGDKIKEAWSNLIDKLKDLFFTWVWGVKEDIVTLVFDIIEAFDMLWDKLKDTKLFKWLSENGAAVHVEGDVVDDGQGGTYTVAAPAASDSQRPGVVNSSSNKTATSSMHIDELNIVAPAANDAQAVAGEIHGALQDRQGLVNYAEAY